MLKKVFNDDRVNLGLTYCSKVNYYTQHVQYHPMHLSILLFLLVYLLSGRLKSVFKFKRIRNNISDIIKNM